MVQPLSYLKETASQTAGPYVHIGLIPDMAGFDIFEKNFSNLLVAAGTKGERITLEGRVLDGSGTLLRDVLLEIWQANAAGRYNHPADRSAGALEEDFRGWGRAGSDFESGLITFASSAGALVMKPATQRTLRLFGFRDTLVWNGVISAVMIAICAAFRPTWPAFSSCGCMVGAGGSPCLAASDDS